MRPMTPASATSSRMIRPREPPMARLMPISRVRSATLMAIVLMTDRPPTMRLTAATPMIIALKIPVVAPTLSLNSAPVMVALFSTLASMADATAAKSAPSARVHDDLADQLARLEGLGHQRRQVTEIDPLGRRQRDEPRDVRGRQGRLERAEHLERLAPNLDGVTRDHAVLAGDGGAEDDDVAGVLDREHPSGRQLEVERLVSGIGSGDDPGHQVRRREADGRIGLPQELDLRLDRRHVVECGDGVGGGEPHRRAAEGLTVGDHDLVGVELGAHADEAVDLVGHRAEHDECPDADGDADDGEGRPQLAPRKLS